MINSPEEQKDIEETLKALFKKMTDGQNQGSVSVGDVCLIVMKDKDRHAALVAQMPFLFGNLK